jgi:GNAT superfamily N-acetyltransferase
MTIDVRPLTADDAQSCDSVILSLPYFFGDPAGRASCAEAVRMEPGFVARVDGAIAGFLTLKQHFPGSVEITWMAVGAGHRRRGLGAKLIGRAVGWCASNGGGMLSVLTLGPSVPEDVSDGYAGTRAFYQAMGFVALRELQLRDWNDSHALILARAV